MADAMTHSIAAAGRRIFAATGNAKHDDGDGLQDRLQDHSLPAFLLFTIRSFLPHFSKRRYM